ncbi:MAG: hypothetical protein KA408_10945 [Flavobacteriales bacterium]|nr:hypothetical protein [Flavobacteriales bacterium]
MTLTLLTAAAVIALRLFLFHSGYPPEGTDFMLVHFFAIVTLIYFNGHRMLTRDPRSRFPDLMRNGFSNAAIYAVIMGVFLYTFYTCIDLEEFPRKIEERVAAVVAAGKTEAEARESLSAMFSPFNYASITFFTLLAVGAFNALVIAATQHKLLRKFIH